MGDFHAEYDDVQIYGPTGPEAASHHAQRVRVRGLASSLGDVPIDARRLSATHALSQQAILFQRDSLAWRFLA
jgi:hypothetical protein